MTVRLLIALPVALSLFTATATRSFAPGGPVDNADRSHAGTAGETIPDARGGFTLTVVLTGVSEQGGRIGAALFDSPEDFLDDDRATQRLVRPRTAPVDSFVFTGLAAGDYAIAAFHDANSNGKIDKNWFGVPKESWGTSGDVRPRMRAPRFDEARVHVAGDVRVQIAVRR